MKIKRRLVAYCSVIVVAASLVILTFRQTATTTDLPVHNRPLSAWLSELLNSNPAVVAAASNAIVQLGTNALPFLRQELSARNSRIELWKAGHGISLFSPDTAELRQIRACNAVKVLGIQARPLEATIIPLCNSAPALRLAAREAAVAIASPSALPMLTNAIASDPSFSSRVEAVRQALQ
jgi:hypothetical protein